MTQQEMSEKVVNDFIAYGKTTCHLGPNDILNVEVNGSLMPTEIDIESDRCFSGAVLKVSLDFPRGAFKHPDEVFSPEGKARLGAVMAETYYQMVMDVIREAVAPGEVPDGKGM